MTEADVLAGEVVNVATAKGKSPDPKEPDVPVEPGKDPEPTVREYRLTINYWIGEEPAAPTYTKVYDSATGLDYNVLSPVLVGYTPDKERVTGTLTEDTIVDVFYTIRIYQLTVHYVYMNGAQAAPDHTEMLAYNTPFSVRSPAIQGYNPSTLNYTGTMPASDVEYTVFYRRIVPGTDIIDDYDTPLGLPNLSLSMGEMYE